MPALNGFIALCKPRGITSNAPIYMMRRYLRSLKIGQTGTLDPLATGLLVVAIGEATKLVSYLDENRKEYIAQFSLGRTSDTYDIEGELTLIDPDPDIDLEKLTNVVHSFTGSYMQTPPLHSAVKINGKPAYAYARKGIKVDLAQRPVEIYDLDLVWYSNAKAKAAIRLVCSKGTYVRSLVNDIGRSLGYGAVMTKLTRTASGQFDLRNCLTIDQLENILRTGNISEHMIKMEDVRYNLASITLTTELASRFTFGQRIPIEEIDRKAYSTETVDEVLQKDRPQNIDKFYLVRDRNRVPIGIGKISSGILAPERVIGSNA